MARAPLRKLLLAAFLVALLAAAPAPRGAAAGDGTACSHPYNPMLPGLTRSYRSTSSVRGMESSSHTESFSGFADDSFTMRVAFSAGTQMEVRFRCASDGTLILESQRLIGAGAQLATPSGTSVRLPPPEDWHPGTKWTETLDISRHPEPGAEPGPEVTGTATITREIVGEEPVTVPAGRFTATKVQATTTQKATVKMPGRPDTPLDNTFHTTSWYARDLGMVKQVNDDPKVTTELVSYTKR